MTVTIPARGGFELEVVTQISNVQAGVLAAGANGAVSTVGAIQFAYSTGETTSWTFSWTPPTTNVGSVVLYVTGGGLSPNYSNNFVMMPAAATAPSIASFVAGAATITAGNSTTLTGVFSNGTGSVDNAVGAVTSGTAVTVKPSATTTYTLTVSGGGTSLTRQATVTVAAAPPLPTISSFAAGAATITAGTSTTLTGVFSNGTGSVNNGVGTATSGTALTVSPAATTTYTLTVTGGGTSVTAQATVTVTPSAGTGTLTSTPSSLSFNYQMGGRLPSSRTLSITSTGGLTTYTAKETDPWLTINPTSGGTPGSIRASVNPAGMAPGSYGAQINITAQNGKTTTVTVALIITSGSGGGGGTTGGMFAQPYMSDTQSGTLAAAWVDNLGASPLSTTDPRNRGLVLAKSASALATAWAGASIQNVTGMSLTELGFDFRAGIQCSADSVHFVVFTSDTVAHTVGGCTSSSTIPASSAPTGWMRLRFNPNQASPPINSPVQSISIELLNGSTSTGSIAVIDNIEINGVPVGKGATSTSRDE